MRATICTLVLLSVAACTAAPAERVDRTRIYTQEEFTARVVGKSFMYIDDSGKVDPRIRIAVLGDGTLSGRGLLDTNLRGTWWWEDSYWCRTLIGRSHAPAEDCQVVLLNDGILTVIRDRGRGQEVQYRTGK